MTKRNLARKIMLSILTGAVLLGNSVAWAAFDDGVIDINGNGTATANGKSGAIAIGSGASSDSDRSIAIGQGASVKTDGDDMGNYNYSVAIGGYTVIEGDSSFAGGEGSKVYGDYSVALGTGSRVGIGIDGAVVAGGVDFTTVLGANAQGKAANGTVVGAQAYLSVGASYGTVIGSGAGVRKANSVAIGAESDVDDSNSVAIGYSSKIIAGASNSVAIGAGSSATEANTVSVGTSSSQRRIVNVADGEKDTDAVNFGQLSLKANVSDVYTQTQIDTIKSGLDSQILANTSLINTNATSITNLTTTVDDINKYFKVNSPSGNGATIDENETTDAIAIGDAANVTSVSKLGNGNGYGGIAVGARAKADGTRTVAIGADSKGIGSYTVALGGYAEANAVNSVAIGYGSVANEEGVVSVGSGNNEDTGGVETRRIINVKAGLYANDATTVGQISSIVGNDFSLETDTGAMSLSYAEGTNYLKEATTLTDADRTLDARIKINADAIELKANIADVKTVIGIDGFTSDDIKSAYQGKSYIADATSLVDADSKLDAAIKAGDITQGDFSDDGTLSLKNASGEQVAAITGFVTQENITSTINAEKITGISYDEASGIITLSKGEGEGEPLTTQTAVASRSEVENIKNIIGALDEDKNLDYDGDSILADTKDLVTADKKLSNFIISVSDAFKGIIGYDDENGLNYKDTNYLVDKASLTEADRALDSAINSLNTKIGDLGQLNIGDSKENIVDALNAVYAEARNHTKVEAGDGITVEGPTGSGTASDSNTGSGSGDTSNKYTVSANITGDGDISEDGNISVTTTGDNKTLVSLNKDIKVESVTTNNAIVKNEITVGDGDTKTTITKDTVNTTNVNATTGRFTDVTVNNNFTVGTENNQTTIQGDTVTTNNVVTNNATVNNTFIVNKDGNTTTIEGDKITTNEIKLGDEINNVTINKEGMTIVNKNTTVTVTENGISLQDKEGNPTGPSINNDGSITGVKDGKIEEGSTDAVNGDQIHKLTQSVDAANNELANRINRVGTRLNKVGAGAAALAALHPLDFDPDDKLSFSAGVGNYAGQNAAALGMFYRPNEKVMLSMGGTMGNGEEMVNMGISFALDKPNNVSNSRVAMAKEINALREHVAKQDAQIAQLVMLVNQLTGNAPQEKAVPAFNKDGRIRVERLSDGYEEYDRVKVVNHKEYGDKAVKAAPQKASK